MYELPVTGIRLIRHGVENTLGRIQSIGIDRRVKESIHDGGYSTLAKELEDELELPTFLRHRHPELLVGII